MIDTKVWCILSVCVLLFHDAVPASDSKGIIYNVVGVFERNAEVQTQAFNQSCISAVKHGHSLYGTAIIPNRTDSYSLWRQLCRSLQTELSELHPIAIFGPQHPISHVVVRDQCAIAQIPHLQAAWQPIDPDFETIAANEEIENPTTEKPFAFEENEEEEANKADDETGKEDEEGPEDTEQNEETLEYKNITINFMPDSEEISRAYARLLKYYDWKTFAAFYEDDYGLQRIQKILAEHSTQYPIFVRKLNPDGENHQILKIIKYFKVDRILLDCHVDRIMTYMKIADNLNVIDDYRHYVFVSPDASVHAEKLTTWRSNATWLSLTEFEKINDTQHYLAPRVQSWKTSGNLPHVTDFQLESLLMADMADHVITSVRNLEKRLETDLEGPSFSICPQKGEEIEPWRYGAALQNEILNTVTAGVTGNIQFNEVGKRVNYTLYVNEIHMFTRNTIGHWNPEVNEILPVEKRANESSKDYNSKHFIIISRKAQPYFDDKKPCLRDNCTDEDNEKYEGFSVDLAKAIFEVMREFGNYTFEFVHEEDKPYGKYDEEKKKWTGLIGDLLDKKADLAICDLTITEERKKVVDFSVPFMSMGISILYTRDHKVVPWMFSFLNPYTFDVWMHTATAYCIVSMVLFICARLSPADWENPQPCDKDPEELENIWNFKNCTWLTMGSIMTQGCDILPKAFGSRWVCAMWWFFAVIVCQTYIAQLSASMTSALENEPINSVDDLAKQNKILYGAIDGGSTLNFFKNSNDKMYQTMYENMMAHDAVLVQNNDEGEKRVINGHNKYAFFMESSTIDYKLKRNCELKKVGGQLDSKDYGIAMPANSPFRTHINRAILKLKEMTTLDKIKNKWWNEMYGAKPCDSLNKNEANDVEGDLEIQNLIGAFVVLVFGLFVCLFITAAEFIDEVRNIVVREQITHKEAFIKELKASLNFFQLQKPVLRNPSRAPSVISDKSQQEAKQERRAQVIENFMDLEKIAQ